MTSKTKSGDISFGKIPKDERSDEDFTLTTRKGKKKYFYYRIYFDREALVIKDTLGRYVPMEISDIDELVTSLLLAKEVAKRCS